MPASLAAFERLLIGWVLRERASWVWAVALFPLVFVAGMIVGKLLKPGFYSYIIAEDGLVEYATFVVYLVACLVALALALDFRRMHERLHAGLYVFLSAGLFLIAMEEISWGQRIFGIASPDLFYVHSTKPEINLHNLRAFPTHLAFAIVGFYGAFSRVLVPPSLERRYPKFVDLVTPHRELFLYFFMTLIMYAYLIVAEHSELVTVTKESFVSGKEQEPIELLLAIGFLLFVVENRYRYSPNGLGRSAVRAAASGHSAPRLP